MTIKRSIKNIAKNKWIYLLIFCIALLSDDSYWAATSGNSMMSAARYAFVVFIPVFYLGILHIKADKKLLRFAIILSTLLFAVSFLSRSGLGGPIMLFFSLLSAAMIVSKIPLTEFSNRFCELIIVLILYSFALQMMRLFGFIEVSSIENVVGSKVSTYGGCIFVGSYFGLILRNACIFREPGVFMVYICIAYMLDIWMHKSGLSLIRQLIYFIGIFSTMSTAGIVIWAVLFFTNVVKSKKVSPHNLMVICVILLVAYFIFSNEILFNNVFGKLERGTDSGSVLGRVSSLYIPFQMTLDSPIWGCGTENFQAEYIKCGYNLYHREIDPQGLATNSILNASAVFGLWYGLFLLYGFWSLSKGLAGRRIIGCVLTFLSVLMTFSNESMQYSLIFYVLIFYGMASYSYKKQIVKPNPIPTDEKDSIFANISAKV